jgi:hypothetical protein
MTQLVTLFADATNIELANKTAVNIKPGRQTLIKTTDIG